MLELLVAKASLKLSIREQGVADDKLGRFVDEALRVLKVVRADVLCRLF